jgi:pimeloyl-ACP methyl ester carboxylesterase
MDSPRPVLFQALGWCSTEAFCMKVMVLSDRTRCRALSRFQDYIGKSQVPLLAVWGKSDPFFLPPGADAYKRDLPNAEVHFLDAGHFALETHAAEIAGRIRNFLGRTEFKNSAPS